MLTAVSTYCRLTNYELLRWLVETPSRDFAHYPDMLQNIYNMSPTTSWHVENCHEVRSWRLVNILRAAWSRVRSPPITKSNVIFCTLFLFTFWQGKFASQRPTFYHCATPPTRALAAGIHWRHADAGGRSLPPPVAFCRHPLLHVGGLFTPRTPKNSLRIVRQWNQPHRLPAGHSSPFMLWREVSYFRPGSRPEARGSTWLPSWGGVSQSIPHQLVGLGSAVKCSPSGVRAELRPLSSFPLFQTRQTASSGTCLGPSWGRHRTLGPFP